VIKVTYSATQTQFNRIHAICQAGKGTPYEQAFEQIMDTLDSFGRQEEGPIGELIAADEARAANAQG
jgi:hypothetical protein